MATLEELFGVASMMAPAVGLFEDLEEWPLVEMFQTGISGVQDGRDAVWDREDLTRELGPVTDRRAGAIALFPEDKDHFRVPMASIRLKRFIDAQQVWIDERGLGELKPNAGKHVRRAMRHLTNARRRTAEYLCAESLFNPTGFTVNATTIPGSEVSFSINWSIPSSTAATAWTTVTTDIVSAAELLGFIDTTINVSGMNPTTMIMNNTGADMLFLNDQVRAWMQTTLPGVNWLRDVGPAGSQGINKMAFPNSIGGIGTIPNWWQFDHGYTPIGGAFTKYLATDNFVMGPGGGPTLGFTEGRSVIPNKAIGASAMEMITIQDGPVFYAILKDDPVGIEIIHKWDFIPVVLLPEAWRRIDPTP